MLGSVEVLWRFCGGSVASVTLVKFPVIYPHLVADFEMAPPSSLKLI